MAYEKYFAEASKKYNVDESLLKAVAKTESDFDADAVSSAGAVGIMQLMPGTAASLGVTDRTDPEQSIMGGAKYLSELLDKYDGDENKALAAYNAGAGNVSKYGAEKYADYYTKVQSNKSLFASTSTAESGNNFELKWWGDVVVVVFILLLMIAGLVFLVAAVKGNPLGNLSGVLDKLKKKG